MHRMTWMSLVVTLLTAACGKQVGPMQGRGAEMMHGGGMGMMQGDGMGVMGGSSTRRAYVVRLGIDPKYAGETNPLPPSPANFDAGKRIYEQSCAACHGATGNGDGPAAKTLDPPPAQLAGLGRMPMMNDGYLYWTIAEGGTPVKSAMPPFKAALGKDDIWKVVLFLRQL